MSQQRSRSSEVAAANDFNLNDTEEAKLRRSCQYKAKIALSNVYQDIKINLEFVETSLEKYKCILGLLNEVSTMLKRWIESDKKRLEGT